MEIFSSSLNMSSQNWAGLILIFTAWVNQRHAEKMLEKAFDMPEDTKTDRICRQIQMLENRVWSQSWWIFFAIGVVVFFV